MNKIIWTPPAEIAYAALFESVAERWSYAIALRLENAVDELIDNLRKYKHFCPAAPTLPNARRCVVNKQTSLIYTVEGDTIYIVSMYDNRSGISF